MGIYVELRDQTGRAQTGLPDPSGGTFDAAGDFDRFVDQPPYGQVPGGLPVLESVDPFGETKMPSGVMARVIADCARGLTVAENGPERRGRSACESWLRSAQEIQAQPSFGSGTDQRMRRPLIG